MIPSYMLCSQEQIRTAFDSAKKATRDEANGKLTPMEASNIVSEMVTEEVLEIARNQLAGYRTTPDQIQGLKDALKVFEGTHSFHNYTRRLNATDPSASRYIMKFVPLDPIIVPRKTNIQGIKQEDAEWIPVQVTGQSFLLNQIRKMISAAVDLARGVVSKEQIEKSLMRGSRMKVNVAPAQGLFLDRSFFEIYNKQLEKKNQNNDHKPLKWVEGEEIPPPGKSYSHDNKRNCTKAFIDYQSHIVCSSKVKRIEQFKNEKIIPHIVEEEAKEGNFLKYLYCQDVLYARDMYCVPEDAGSTKTTSCDSDGADD